MVWAGLQALEPCEVGLDQEHLHPFARVAFVVLDTIEDAESAFVITDDNLCPSNVREASLVGIECDRVDRLLLIDTVHLEQATEEHSVLLALSGLPHDPYRHRPNSHEIELPKHLSRLISLQILRGRLVLPFLFFHSTVVFFL